LEDAQLLGAQRAERVGVERQQLLAAAAASVLPPPCS